MLVQDYGHLRADVQILSEADDLQDYEQQDLSNNQRWLAAMETMLEYYLTPDRFRDVVGRDR